MKIAILTSGILPVPAVLGGAVENLIDFYLEYNNQHHLHDITVYSVYHPDIKKHPALKSGVNHYKYIKVDGWQAKIKRNIYHLTHGKEYYHYSIEYVLYETINDIRHQQYDVVVMENRPGYALKLKGKVNAKIAYHLHNDFLNINVENALELYEAASRIITVSEYVNNRVRTIISHDIKCVTVYNGINTHVFINNVPAKHLSSINNNDFVIVFSGRINNEKGIMELISAMNIIGKNNTIKLMVLGSSFYGNAHNENSFVSKLREMAAPIKDHIIFTGFIPYTEMPNYLKLADIAVLPSTWDEPFGLTIVEAQAMGLPIITTRRGGIPEIVTEENAILLDTNEHLVNNLAAAILDLYEHKEKSKKMSSASLKRSKLFDKDVYARNFFEALEGC